jgi:murein DD-endopeptidase MepM/ murein hydrolase activator NlpD
MPGRVVAVGERSGFEGYGNIVQVALGGGYTALYAHLASWRVRVGDVAEAGEAIATAGCTGWCSGTHLHFELRLRGRPVDPMRFYLR